MQGKCIFFILMSCLLLVGPVWTQENANSVPVVTISKNGEYPLTR